MSVIDFQQRRGVAWDIIDEAILAYDNWMLDDDYDAQRKLNLIITKMRERRDLYRRTTT